MSADESGRIPEDDREKMAEAFSLMLSALALLDDAKAPAHVTAILDLAVERLRARIDGSETPDTG